MRTIALACFILMFSTVAFAATADKLNGKWHSDIMTVAIDLEKGSYDAVALGQEKKSKVKVLSEKGDTVELDVNGQPFTAKFVDDNTIIMSKAGGIPVKLVRR